MKEKICPYCKKPFTGKRKYCCDEGTINAMLSGIKQMNQKQGPIYEKWKRAMIIHAQRLKEGR